MLIKKCLKEIQLCETSFPSANKKKDHEFLFCKIDTSRECGEVLVVDFYSAEKELDKRFFTDGKNWLTLEDGKWSTKNINEGYYYSSPEYIESKESGLISKDFFARHDYKYWREETGAMISNFISEKSSERRQQYADNKYRRMMDQIDSVPKPPAEVMQYCNDFVFSNRYIVLKKEKKNKKSQCKCLSCGKTFPVAEKPKHKSRAICPKCEAPAIVIAERYISSVKDKTKLLIMHNVNGFLQKEWNVVERRYQEESFKEIYSFDPYYYEIRTEKGIYCYHYVTMYWFSGFSKTKYTCSDKAHVYAGNIEALYDNGWIFNMNLNRLRHAGMISFTELLYNARNYPATWQLYKIGLFNLAASYGGSFRGNTFEEVLGVSKNYLPIFRKYNVNTTELEAVKLSGSFINEEVFSKLSKLIRIGNGYGMIEKMKEILEHMTFIKMVNYFSKQSEYKPKRNLADWFTLYLDYIKMTKQLNSQLPKKKRIDLNEPNTRYPKDIQKAHDRVSNQLTIKKNAKKDRMLKQIGKQIEESYSFSHKDMTIVIPRGIEDFINEGNKLSHCVGSNSIYMDSHIDGSCRVLFIRKMTEPEKPFYTLTIYVKDYKVRECQGKSHKAMTSEVKQFVEAYQKYLGKAQKPADNKVA